ncbi:MAG: tryptophan synthase subunit alpha [bacterium]
MNRIQNAFANTSPDHKLFIPYLCAGDPDLQTSLKLLQQAEQSGADLIELGIPFSDPIADGPTIQEAVVRSLESGTGLDDIFNLVEKFRARSDLPLVLMTYYNPVLRRGEEEFVKRAAAAGADGILVVDLPPEEGMGFFELAHSAGLDSALLATPTTELDRARELSDLARGYLYYVMVKGVTGVRSGYEETAVKRLEEIYDISSQPLVAGFGISNYDSAREYIDHVDGLVVGSAIIDKVAANLEDTERMLKEVDKVISSLADPLHGKNNA